MSQVVQRPHVRRRSAATAAAPGLLCVCNFPANTGYAWVFIESLYAGLADRLAGRGVRTFVAYPEMAEAPRTLAGSQATAVQLNIALDDTTSLKQTLAFIRQHNIEVLYFCDRSAWNPRYPALRRAGVRRIIVHDHTSGARTEPRGLKRVLKRARLIVPGTSADDVIAVSDFVAHRKRTVDLLAPERITRVWNSVGPVMVVPGASAHLRGLFGIAEGRAVVACAARATPEKGVETLLRAFDRTVRDAAGEPPVLVYMGDGPALDALRELAESLPARAHIVMAGYVPNAMQLIAGADICVVPSVWQEAFGLAALEPMANGVAVIASRAGGIPEVVVDGETGVLVTPGDEIELAAAITELLVDRAKRERLAANGRVRAREVFSRERQLDQLEVIVTTGFNDQRQTR